MKPPVSSGTSITLPSRMRRAMRSKPLSPNSLEVTGAGGRAAGGRLEVSALPRLTRRAALALAGVIEESFGGVADCRRTGRRRFVCEQPLRDPVTGNCTVLIEITQRANGRTAIMDPESCA